MLKKVCVGLIVLIALLQGVGGDAMGDAGGIMMLLLVVAGLVYGAVGIDAEDATGYCTVTIAVALAAHHDVLTHINLADVGMWLDGIMDAASVALLSGVASILAVRTYNRLMG